MIGLSRSTHALLPDELGYGVGRRARLRRTDFVPTARFLGGGRGLLDR